MLLHLLGSCSGTEPMPGRDYTAWVLEIDGETLYWFDAGGACASSAYHRGLSPLAIRALFLSHPHLDHTAGLPGILQTIRKEKWLRRRYDFRQLPVYSSTPELVQAADVFLKADENTPGDDEWDFELRTKELFAGEIHHDDRITVEALPNRHMTPHPVTGKPRSYSFRIRSSGQVIVYSGDLKALEELAEWLAEPIDLLMLETGHHRAADLCRRLRLRQTQAASLLFLHHGVEILRDPAAEKKAAETVWEAPVLLAADGMTLTLPEKKSGL